MPTRQIPRYDDMNFQQKEDALFVYHQLLTVRLIQVAIAYPSLLSGASHPPRPPQLIGSRLPPAQDPVQEQDHNT